MAPACTHPRQIIADGRLLPCAACWDSPTLKMPELRPFSGELRIQAEPSTPLLEFTRSGVAWAPVGTTDSEPIFVSVEMVAGARRKAEAAGVTASEWWRERLRKRR